MKKIIILITLVLSFACDDSKTERQIVELSCGQCQFNLKSQDGCDLAVRINDKSYFVDGADIDAFGDAHDKNTGFCEVIRKAEVKGELINDRFQVSSVKLLD